MSPRKLVSQHSVPDSRAIKAMLARLGYVEEEKPLIPGVIVRAASTEKLVCLAVDCFGTEHSVICKFNVSNLFRMSNFGFFNIY